MFEKQVIELLTEIRDALVGMTSSASKVQREAKQRADDAKILMDSVMNMLPKEVAAKLNRKD